MTSDTSKSRSRRVSSRMALVSEASNPTTFSSSSATGGAFMLRTCRSRLMKDAARSSAEWRRRPRRV